MTKPKSRQKLSVFVEQGNFATSTCEHRLNDLLDSGFFQSFQKQIDMGVTALADGVGRRVDVRGRDGFRAITMQIFLDDL